jgi:hypothetical protein
MLEYFCDNLVSVDMRPLVLFGRRPKIRVLNLHLLLNSKDARVQHKEILGDLELFVDDLPVVKVLDDHVAEEQVHPHSVLYFEEGALAALLKELSDSEMASLSKVFSQTQVVLVLDPK